MTEVTTDGSDINSKIFGSIANVFQAAQLSYAGHRKHVAVLKKIQTKAIAQGYEDAFNYWFNRLILAILPLKKTEVVGDRIIKLVASFIASLDKEIELAKAQGKPLPNNAESAFTKFVDHFIRNILRGIESKDKNVRFRVVQLLAVIMDNIGEIDESLYELLTWSLNKRIYDKDPNVRIQAVFCLTKFQAEDVGRENEPSNDLIAIEINESTKTLMSLIQNDPSAEVRRAAMLNLISLPATLPYILERARDVNQINRRLYNINEVLYDNFPEASRLAEYLQSYINKAFKDNQSQSITDNDKKHLEFIIEQILMAADKYDYSDEIGRRSMLTVVRNFLGIKSLSVTSIKIGIDVLKTLSINEKDFITMVIEMINDIRDEDIDMQEKEEKAAKRKSKKSKKLQKKKDKQSSTEVLVNKKNDDLGDAQSAKKDTTLETSTFDYADDDESSNEEESDNEDENENDGDDDDLDSFHSAVEGLVNGDSNTMNEAVIMRKMLYEKEARPDTLILCLTRSGYMLELVSSSIQENILIASLIDTLITPAVRNSEPTVRELGIKNLGLCCLLDAQLATENIYILGMCVSKGNESLKMIALQVLFDIFALHGNVVVDGEGKVDSISLHKIFYKVLKNTELPSCQKIAAEGLCKLFLADIFTDDDLFETLVLSYYTPANSANEELIQAFAFCLPVYCYSHINHQNRMARIGADILLRLCVLWDEFRYSDEYNDEKMTMLKPNIIFQQLIDWTDPRKIINRDEKDANADSSQIRFLLDVLKIVPQIEKSEIKRLLLNNINLVHLHHTQEYSTLKQLEDNIIDILENDAIDQNQRNSLTRFKLSLQDVIEKTESKLDEHSDADTSTEQYSMILESSQVYSKPPTRNDEQNCSDEDNAAALPSELNTKKRKRSESVENRDDTTNRTNRTDTSREGLTGENSDIMMSD
ncbi:Condensin complex subunit 3 [Nakaseomyces glabratus]|nr:Condensin complex subunit 3 [Nakaseomyces glabratus]KTB26605.1 Condensin complex subunit 3 [Nakaseomyces glabratus]